MSFLSEMWVLLSEMWRYPMRCGDTQWSEGKVKERVLMFGRPTIYIIPSLIRVCGGNIESFRYARWFMKNPLGKLFGSEVSGWVRSSLRDSLHSMSYSVSGSFAEDSPRYSLICLILQFLRHFGYRQARKHKNASSSFVKPWKVKIYNQLQFN